MRRNPKKARSEREAQQLDALLRGGLDGASRIPVPVGQAAYLQEKLRGRPVSLVFVREVHESSATLRTGLSLAAVPVSGSVSVYLCQGGYGKPLIQDHDWSTVAGEQQEIRLSLGGDIAYGAKVVVHYAHT